MAWRIKYWDFYQQGLISDVAANSSSVIPFCANFSIGAVPVVHASYQNCEGSTTCVSNVSTANFTLHTGLVGTVGWTASYCSTC